MANLTPATKAQLVAGDQGAPNASTSIGMSRAMQEVQAQVIVAMQNPRDETRALGRILEACKRKKLAEHAQYAYPKGGQVVEGPSIRLAETMARYWGNLDYGVAEIEQRNGESQMLAYCWDLETNTRSTKAFTVRHWRDTRQGGYALKDSRDIYELTANQGARRVRACILAILPGDIVDAAVEACAETLAGKSSEPLIDRLRKMIQAFVDLGQGVTQEMIVERLGHRLEATSEQELATLRKIYASLRDHMSTPASWFEAADKNKGGRVSELNKTAEKTFAEEWADAAKFHEELLNATNQMEVEETRQFWLDAGHDYEVNKACDLHLAHIKQHEADSAAAEDDAPDGHLFGTDEGIGQ